MRRTTIGELATVLSNDLGCTHQEAVVEICCRHKLAEITAMPVLVFRDGTVERLHRHPIFEIAPVDVEVASVDLSLLRREVR